MGIRKTVTKGLSKMITPTQWLGLDSLKQNGNLIGQIAKAVFSLHKQKGTDKRSFAECMQQYGLTDADIEQKMQKSMQVVWFCLGLAAVVLGYGLYLVIVGNPLSSLVCAILTLVMLAQAFREHFNYFQMDQRRLGCTYREWWHYLLKGRRR